MKFAFNSMTRGNDSSAQTGMVYGMEVVPWAENTVFLGATEFETESQLSWPLGRELIPNKPCRGGLVEDDVGKCCREDNDLKIYEKVDPEGGSSKQTRVCEPSRPYPFELMKHNMMTNAEFVAQMDSALRLKMNNASTLQACVSHLKGLPSRYDDYFLQTSDTVADGNVNLSLTVKELRDALDPDGKMTSVKLINWELDEFMEMFYSPCLSALHGLNSDVSNKSLEMKMDHFMLEPYYNLPQCKHLSCLFDNARWDRSAGDHGGCKAGLLMGIDASHDKDIYNGENHPTRFNLETHEVESKTSGEMIWNEWIFPENQKLSIGSCWGNPGFTPFNLMDQYCLPRVTHRKKKDGEASIVVCEQCTGGVGGTCEKPVTSQKD